MDTEEDEREGVRIVVVCFGVFWWCFSCSCSVVSPGGVVELAVVTVTPAVNF